MEDMHFTKTQYFMAIMQAAQDGAQFPLIVGEDKLEIPPEEIIEFCNKQINQLAASYAKAKDREAKRRAEGDELTKSLMSLMSETPKTINEIVEAFDDPDVTRGKVIYRMGKLAREGKVEKIELRETNENNNRKRVSAYALPMPSAFE